MPAFSLFRTTACVALLALAGCDGPAVTSYIAPIDSTANSVLPVGWQRRQPGPMQLERFVFQREDGEWTEITVSKLGGDGGGLAANINRWRGQLGLPPVAEAEALAASTPAEGQPAGTVWVEMEGIDSRTMQPTRTLVLVVPRTGETWYYKITGHPEVAASQRDAAATFAGKTSQP